ncbi:MAG: ABC transporter substrate-binding protein [Desulfotomaculales bacterium]
MRKVLVLLLAGVLVGLGVWLYLVQRGPAHVTVIVYEAGRSFASLPLYVAALRGFFAEPDLDVKLCTGAAIAPQPPAKADVYVVPFDRLPRDSIAFALLTNSPGYFLYCRERPSSFRWEDVRDKVILGEEAAADAEVVLEHILRRHGLQPQTDVHLIQNIPPQLRRPAWEAGTGDYILLPQPEGLWWEEKGKAHLAASLQEAEPVLGLVCAAPRTALSAREDLYARFAAGLFAAQRWVADHSAEETAAQVGRFFPHLNYRTLLRGVNLYRDAGWWAATPEPPQKSYDRLQEMRRLAGEVAAPPRYALYVDPRAALNGIELIEAQKEKTP